MQDLYYEAKLDGTIIEVSPSISIMSKGQYTRDDLIGRSMYEIYSNPDDRNSLLDLLRIWLTSEQGRGTTFYFTIPVEKQVVKVQTDSDRPLVEGFVFAEKKTILVAEDIDSKFKLISYFLSRANTKILRAINGKEAVDKMLEGEKIDLILIDVKMPVMDGYTAVKLIREKNSDIPIIAQTAYADDKDKAIECGCSGFISKPFDKKSLLKAMSEFI